MTYSKAASGKNPAFIGYSGYRFDVANISGNTINSVSVEATAAAADLQELVEFVSSDGATCQLSTSPAGSPKNAVTITCPVGQLKAGAGKTFFVFLKAPSQDTTSVTSPDYIDLQGRTLTAEGLNGGNSPNNSVDFWPLATQTPPPDTCSGGSIESPTSTTHLCIKVPLGTPDGSRIKSAVPKGGGLFFTGNGGVPGYVIDGVTDLFTTSVTVPSSAIIASATIDEGPADLPNVTCTNFYACFATQLTIVDTQTFDAFGNPVPADYSPAYLRIVARMDSTNILPGTKIGKVIVYYNGVAVADCPSPTTPIGGGVPCIAQRTAYKQNPGPGVDPALSNDFEWVILNNHNGSIMFF